MIRYFYGEDSYAAREAIGELARKEKARLNFWDAESLDEQSLAEKLERGGGLFGKELGVIRASSSLRKSLQEILVNAAEKNRPADVILWDEEPDKRSLVFKHFQKQARVFPDLPANKLQSWLTAEAKARSVEIEPGAITDLIARIGSDRWRLLSELEKLSLQSEKITSQRVAAEVPERNMAGEIFEMLRLITAGKKSEAIRQLENLLTGGNSEFYILSMLAYQFRKLYLQERSVPSLNNLSRVVATDFAIKQGKVDARTGVTMLIASL